MNFGRRRYFIPAGDDGSADSGVDTSSTEDTTTPDNTDQAELLEVVRKERARTAQTEKDLRAAKKAQKDAEERLHKLEAIDPEKYQQMLARQTQMEEEELQRKGNWDGLKKKYQLEKDTDGATITELNKQISDMKISTALEKAFRLTGGIEETDFDGETDSIRPIDLIDSYLRPRIKMVDGQITITSSSGEPEANKDGSVKTLSQKMVELRGTTLGHLFKAENNSSGGSAPANTVNAAGQKMAVYTREQAASGSADIDAIAEGRATVR
jgi:hypothetical protein